MTEQDSSKTHEGGSSKSWRREIKSEYRGSTNAEGVAGFNGVNGLPCNVSHSFTWNVNYAIGEIKDRRWGETGEDESKM